MRNNSKRQGGFTLIEVIISISLIGILSVGAYSLYLSIMRNTKEGEVKQQSALVGKQLVEQIKTSKSNIEIKDDGKLKLTEKIELVSTAILPGISEEYSGGLKFDTDGNLVEGDSYKYETKIEMIAKKTGKALDENRKPIIIDKTEGGENNKINIKDIYVVNQNGVDRLVTDKADDFKAIDKDINIKITISKDNNATIMLDGLAATALSFPFDKDELKLNMEVKYCNKKVRIEIENKSKKKINLCILNTRLIEDDEGKSVRNVSVLNTEGILNEYYREEPGEITGALYDFNIYVYEKNGDGNLNELFKSSFVKNINLLAKK